MIIKRWERMRYGSSKVEASDFVALEVCVAGI